MPASNYWLAQWLDQSEIHSEWELEHTLHSQTGFNSVLDAVFEASDDVTNNPLRYPEPTELSDAIVAGRKLDLSGTVSCPIYDCLRRNVDTTFRRIWHYFDQIVVEGIAPQWLAQEIKRTDAEHFPRVMQRIRDQARLLLYLREIDAERFVIFAPKSHAFCQEHWKQHARDLGLDAAVDESRHDNVIREIIESSKFDITAAPPDGWHVTITGKYFEEPEYSTFYPAKGESLTDPPTPESIARGVIGNHATAMISDVSLSRRLTLPLVEPVGLPWLSQSQRDGDKSAENNAIIRLGLPVFDDLATRDFLKLREDERPDFETFRAALGKAIKSQMAENPSEPPAVIARNIESEYLRPGLADIERRFQHRRKALVKKTTVNLAIGTSVAAIGAIKSMPLMVEGFAALGSAIPLAPIVQKFVDDGESIRMSELYFLWQAKKKDAHG